MQFASLSSPVFNQSTEGGAHLKLQNQALQRPSGTLRFSESIKNYAVCFMAGKRGTGVVPCPCWTMPLAHVGQYQQKLPHWSLKALSWFQDGKRGAQEGPR